MSEWVETKNTEEKQRLLRIRDTLIEELQRMSSDAYGEILRENPLFFADLSRSISDAVMNELQNMDYEVDDELAVVLDED
jgi:hypothetical protein